MPLTCAEEYRAQFCIGEPTAGVMVNNHVQVTALVISTREGFRGRWYVGYAGALPLASFAERTT